MPGESVISVIVPTRNRANSLATCLASLLGQDGAGQHVEIIVVDNGSSDATRSVVTDIGHGHSNLSYEFEPKPGLHNGRHRGMKKAAGDVLVFVDDDIEAQPGWLTAIDKAFAEPSVALAGGNNLPKFLATPPNWLLRLWERSVYSDGRALGPLSLLELPGDSRLLDPMYVWGCNFAVRKQVLLDAGGFHPDAMPPELLRFRGDGETHVSQFVQDAGLKSMFLSGAVVHHHVPPDRMTFAYFRKRGFCQGISNSYTNLRAGLAPEPQTKSPLQKARRIGGRLRDQLGQAGHGPNRALAEFFIGVREGSQFHQSAYREDPEVRKWVHRDHYY